VEKKEKDSAQLIYFAENSTDTCPLKVPVNLAKWLGKVAMTYFLSGD